MSVCSFEKITTANKTKIDLLINSSDKVITENNIASTNLMESRFIQQLIILTSHAVTVELSSHIPHTGFDYFTPAIMVVVVER